MKSLCLQKNQIEKNIKVLIRDNVCFPWLLIVTLQNIVLRILHSNHLISRRSDCSWLKILNTVLC